jgi:hypothetical protein
MFERLNPTTTTLAAAALSVAFAACGGGENTATLHLMDAPPEGVTAVKLTVAAMQLHVVPGKDGPSSSSAADDDSIDDHEDAWRSLTVGRQIDLVQHQGETAADVLGELGLPEGKITQIRLVLDTSEPANNVATFRGADCTLDVAKVAKKGIKIPHAFKAFQARADGRTSVWVDFELDKSLKSSGDCFELEPKLKLHKVKLDDDDFVF